MNCKILVLLSPQLCQCVFALWGRIKTRMNCKICANLGWPLLTFSPAVPIHLSACASNPVYINNQFSRPRHTLSAQCNFHILPCKFNQHNWYTNFVFITNKNMFAHGTNFCISKSTYSFYFCSISFDVLH